MSRPRVRRALARFMQLSACCAALPGTAVAAQPLAQPGRVLLPGNVFDMDIGPSGSLALVTHSSDELYSPPVSLIVDPPRLGPPTPLGVPSDDGVDDVDAALDGSGGVAVIGRRDPDPGYLDAVTFAEGTPDRTQRLVDREANILAVAAGGGAAAVAYYEGNRDDGDPARVAIRPAGSTEFLPGVSITGGTPYPLSQDLHLAFGPDGTGVLISTKLFSRNPPILRRIHRDGTLGPGIPIGHLASQIPTVAAAWRTNGDLILALTDIAPKRPGLQIGIWTMTLPAGSDKTTSMRRISTLPGNSTTEENFDLIVTPDDRTVLVAAAIAPQRLRFFSGRGSALSIKASIRVRDPAGAQLAATPAGRVAAAWSGTTDRARDHRAIMGTWMTSASASSFGKASLLTTPIPQRSEHAEVVELGQVLGLPTGGIAIAYSEWEQRPRRHGSYASRFSLPPVRPAAP